MKQLLVRLQIMMNATGVHGKRSSLERSLDKLIFCIFVLLAIICMIDAIGSSKWVNKVGSISNLSTRLLQSCKPCGQSWHTASCT